MRFLGYAIYMSRTTKRFIMTVLIPVSIFLIVHYLPTNPIAPRPNQTNTVPVKTTAPETTNASCYMNGQLPDATCTPGATNPDVTQANLAQTICVSGYTKTIRPPVTYTDNLKLQQMQAYGFNDSPRMHEEDHLISLELGGSPTDPKNLWPEPGASPNPKDKIENFLHAAVCAGKISLQDAQTRISQNWVTAEQGL
jgi:hypothetical protein